MTPSSHSLFSVFGVEIEYAIVQPPNFGVIALAEKLVAALGGDANAHPYAEGVELDNELAAHVLELKGQKPFTRLSQALPGFLAMAQKVDAALRPLGGRLLPGAMHPFMDPEKDSRLWTGEDNEIYAAYDRIFGCKGHGWFNLQSVHLNLPFNGDSEFARLHSAIALVLPLLPAAAASSPAVEGRLSNWQDARLKQYALNQRKVPEIAGDLVPEAMGSESEYRERILSPMYKAIAPLDPEGTLQDEWLNSRAAIARFDRSAIEIRCLDSQECPSADLAMCHLAAGLVRHLCQGSADLLGTHRKVPAGLLKNFFMASAEKGASALIPNEYPWQVFGLSKKPNTVGEALLALAPNCAVGAPEGDAELLQPVLEMLLRRGNLSSLLAAKFKAGKTWSELLRGLCDGLVKDEIYEG
jgi:gamma-glutamyl:cysteine ligase YbdK (ATP-grasp superfamily)